MKNLFNTQNTRTVYGEFLFNFSILVIGVINLVWHHYSDYKLNYWLAENFYNIDLMEYWSQNDYKENGIWLMGSLYVERTLLTIFINLFVIVASGFVTTRLFYALYKKSKVKTSLLLWVLILWLIKIPIPYYYSTLPSTEAGLFAW